MDVVGGGLSVADGGRLIEKADREMAAWAEGMIGDGGAARRLG